jgi:hypothetical protein
MERLNPNRGLETLRGANASLVRFLHRFSTASEPGVDYEIDALLALEKTLQSVGALLSTGLQNSDEPAVREEFRQYRDNLVALHRELSGMQDRALASRARLYFHQNHLQTVKAWCHTSRETQ